MLSSEATRTPWVFQRAEANTLWLLLCLSLEAQRRAATALSRSRVTGGVCFSPPEGCRKLAVEMGGVVVKWRGSRFFPEGSSHTSVSSLVVKGGLEPKPTPFTQPTKARDPFKSPVPTNLNHQVRATCVQLITSAWMGEKARDVLSTVDWSKSPTPLKSRNSGSEQ